LAFQFSDSQARVILTTKEGLSVALAAFNELGIPKSEHERRIIIVDRDETLSWATSSKPRGASIGDATAKFIHFEDLLELGELDSEERFEGKLSNETVVLCYSSVRPFSKSMFKNSS
jgi:hypothetical protein